MKRRIKRFMNKPRLWVLDEGVSFALILKSAGAAALMYAAVLAISILPID